jgi:hypothetical protein
VSLVDHSLLKLCQDGDVGTLSRYFALHHDKVPARSLNTVNATGKVKTFFAINVGGRQYPPPPITTSGHSQSHSARNETEPCNSQGVPFDHESDLNGNELKRRKDD